MTVVLRSLIINSTGILPIFGCDDFNKKGLSLFTIRNGNWDKKDKMYCEKIMVADEEQETPMHFHWNKTEDLINRGGGNRNTAKNSENDKKSQAVSYSAPKSRYGI